MPDDRDSGSVEDFIVCLRQPGTRPLSIDEMNEVVAGGWATAQRNIGNEIIDGLEGALRYLDGDASGAVAHVVDVSRDVGARAVREDAQAAKPAD